MLSVFSVVAVAGFAAAYISPLGAIGAPAEAVEIQAVSQYAHSIGDAQALVTGDQAATALDRSGMTYTVYVTPKPTPTPTPVSSVGQTAESSSESASSWQPPFVSPDPGSAQAIAYEMIHARGWGDDEFACLVALWNRESGWRVNAHNSSSGAYGIPQSLPGNKMASAGADWETNPATQISWGLGYISGRYGAPCGAWGHSQARGWY